MRLLQEKWLLAAAVVAFPLQVYAQDFTPDNSRILSDPTYLPLAGQIYGDSQYSFSDAHQKSFDALGNQVFRFNNLGNDVSQDLAYGITDDLSVHGHIAYDWLVTGRTDALGTSFNRDRNGFTDPSFGVTYRLLDQATFPVDLDLTGNYAPDVFSSRGASDLGDGTVARGGQSGNFGVKIGRETQFFTIQAGFAATDFGTRTLEDSTGAVADKQSSFWSYAFDLATQTRLTDQFAINAGVTETLPQNSRVFNYATALSRISQPGDGTNLNVGLRYQLVPNQVVAGVDYNYVVHNTDSTIYPDPTANLYTRNQHEDVISASLQYAFP